MTRDEIRSRFKCQKLQVSPPPPLPFLFDRDVNHDGREFDIRRVFGEGRTMVENIWPGRKREKGENVS